MENEEGITKGNYMGSYTRKGALPFFSLQITTNTKLNIPTRRPNHNIMINNIRTVPFILVLRLEDEEMITVTKPRETKFVHHLELDMAAGAVRLMIPRYICRYAME